MTRSEYQELREFFVVRFDAIDRRFDAIEKRLIRIELLMEDTRHQIQILAERVGGPQTNRAVGSRAAPSRMAKGFGLFGRAPDQGRAN